MQIKEAGRMKAIRKRVEAASSDLDRFVSEQNVASYRKLLEKSKDETQRLIIAKLLADEVANLRKM
jgi:aminoglycoside phosphotransferase